MKFEQVGSSIRAPVIEKRKFEKVIEILWMLIKR